MEFESLIVLVALFFASASTAQADSAVMPFTVMIGLSSRIATGQVQVPTESLKVSPELIPPTFEEADGAGGQDVKAVLQELVRKRTALESVVNTSSFCIKHDMCGSVVHEALNRARESLSSLHSRSSSSSQELIQAHTIAGLLLSLWSMHFSLLQFRSLAARSEHWRQIAQHEFAAVDRQRSAVEDMLEMVVHERKSNTCVLHHVEVANLRHRINAFSAFVFEMEEERERALHESGACPAMIGPMFHGCIVALGSAAGPNAGSVFGLRQEQFLDFAKELEGYARKSNDFLYLASQSSVSCKGHQENVNAEDTCAYQGDGGGVGACSLREDDADDTSSRQALEVARAVATKHDSIKEWVNEDPVAAASAMGFASALVGVEQASLAMMVSSAVTISAIIGSYSAALSDGFLGNIRIDSHIKTSAFASL